MRSLANKKAADLVRRLHNEAKLRPNCKDLLEEAATAVRVQATQIERLQELVVKG